MCSADATNEKLLRAIKLKLTTRRRFGKQLKRVLFGGAFDSFATRESKALHRFTSAEHL